MGAEGQSAPVVVIGGGISGLTVAYRLANAGIPVHVVEASDQLGGLGMGAEIDGIEIERFYHCIMPTDDHLLGLMSELGMAGEVRWHQTTMGMNIDGARYALNTPADLLKFRPLTLAQRLRFGVVSLLLRRLGRGKDLDNLRTEDWLRGVYGDAIWQRLLQPLFGAKFGAAFGDVPALYLYQRLGRESNVAIRGYPNGSYSAIVRKLSTTIEDNGGQISTGVRVERMSSDGSGTTVKLRGLPPMAARSVVSTVPLPVLRAVADDELMDRLPRVQLEYQGVINAVFLLDKPLDGHYWAPVVNCCTDFDGVIEMSALTGVQRYDGRTLVYAMHYCDRTSELFDEAESLIAKRWSYQLMSLYPDRIRSFDDIHAVEVFKAPFVEPVHSTGYGAQVPDIEVPGTQVLLATTAQIYPKVTSWNSSVELAERVVERLLEQQPAGAPEAVMTP